MTMRRAIRASAALLLLCLPLSAAAAQKQKTPTDPRAPGLSGTERLAALIERVRQEQQKMKTLEASFVQRQESSLLVAPEESRGTFSYAAPDRVRWEYSSPNPISVVIQGTEMTTWYRDLNRADKLKIGRYSNQVFKYLGASGSMESLLEYFNVRLLTPKTTSEPYKLELTPRYARVGKRLKSMTLWIDGERFLPVRLKYTEPGGDTTEYEFRDVKLNANIPAERFELKLPKGVETREIDLGGESKAKS